MDPWTEKKIVYTYPWQSLDGKCHMTYECRNPDGSSRGLYYAQSPDGVTWTKCGAWDPSKHPSPPAVGSIEDVLGQADAFVDSVLMR